MLEGWDPPLQLTACFQSLMAVPSPLHPRPHCSARATRAPRSAGPTHSTHAPAPPASQVRQASQAKALLLSRCRPCLWPASCTLALAASACLAALQPCRPPALPPLLMSYWQPVTPPQATGRLLSAPARPAPTLSPATSALPTVPPQARGASQPWDLAPVPFALADTLVYIPATACRCVDTSCCWVHVMCMHCCLRHAGQPHLSVRLPASALPNCRRTLLF